MKLLDAGEVQVGKVFSDEYDFTIPDYQRPYAWGKDETLQLLDDLKDALFRTTDEPYFFGSIVLVKQKGEPAAEVIDGQQRLTTLTILCAVLRDLTGNPALRADIHKFIEEPEVVWDNKPARPRLRLRKRDAAFFKKHVQVDGSIDGLKALSGASLDNDSQKAIRDNAAALHQELTKWSDDERTELFKMLGGRTYLVVVSTPNLMSAYRIFSVMNSRGLPLTAPDIFKSTVVGAITDEDDRAAYADTWEDYEQELGRDEFAELFLHLRTLVTKTKAVRGLLIEFPDMVLSQYLPDNARGFIDDFLGPYAQANMRLLNRDFDSSDTDWAKVNAWLQRLAQFDNQDWRPAALWALKNHTDDPVFLDAFLRKLERLAASFHIRRIYTTPRVTRYNELLKQLANGDGHDADAFDLSGEEKQDTLDKLGSEIYLVGKITKFVLLRTDEVLARASGVTYQHKQITIEHVLPQTPKSDSVWVQHFSDEQRAHWTHRLGNLVLLNKAKNSSANNFDFDYKKSTYFSTDHGVTNFALTSQVIQQPVWTPGVVEARHKALLALLAKEWELA